MKIVTLLAGVAALALTASAASAQDIRVGQYTNGLNQGNISAPGDTSTNNTNETNLIRSMARDGTQARSAWFAEGSAADNIGGAGDASDGATYTMTGSVSTDCAYYTGDTNARTLDFGQIGIFTSDSTGPTAAFTMVDQAAVTIDTNLAGCNTANTVTLSKTDLNGMVSDNGGGFDSAVFQNNLPYSVSARYTASGTGTAAVGVPQTLLLDTGSNSTFRKHGAWKSAMALDVVIPKAAKALVAGNYSGTFSVTISAGI